MCLIASLSATSVIKQRPTALRAFKVFNVSQPGVLRSPIHLDHEVMKPGWVSAGFVDKLEHDRQRINEGLHIFLSKESANSFKYDRDYEEVVKITVNSEDVVAVNGYKDEAVVTRFHISTEEWERIWS